MLLRLTGDVIDLLNKESIVNFSRGSFVIHLAVDRNKYDHHNAQTIINLNVMSADLKGLYTVDIQPRYHYDGTPERYSLFIRGDIKRQRPSKYGTYKSSIHYLRFKIKLIKYRFVFANWRTNDKTRMYWHQNAIYTRNRLTLSYFYILMSTQCSNDSIHVLFSSVYSLFDFILPFLVNRSIVLLIAHS